MKKLLEYDVYILSGLALAFACIITAQSGRFAAASVVFAAVCAAVCGSLTAKPAGAGAVKSRAAQKSLSKQYIITQTALSVIFNDLTGFFEYALPLWLFLVLQIGACLVFTAFIIYLDPKAAMRLAARRERTQKKHLIKLIHADLRYLLHKYPANEADIKRLAAVLDSPAQGFDLQRFRDGLQRLNELPKDASATAEFTDKCGGLLNGFIR